MEISNGKEHKVLTQTRPAGIFIVVASLITLPGLFTLISIGWPDFIQGMGAIEAVAIMEQNWGAVRLGNFILFIANILWFPAVWFVARLLFDKNNLWVEMALWFAVASLAIRTIWWGMGLTVYPIFIELMPSLSPAAAEAMDAFYIVLNDTMSTVQEDIGVNILGGISGLILSVLMISKRVVPVWIGYMGAAGHVFFIISSAELIGLNAGDFFAMAAPTLMNFWLTFIGIVLILRNTEVSVLVADPSKA